MSTEKLLEALKKDKNKKSGFGPRPKRMVMAEEGDYLSRILPNKSDPDGLPYERVFLHFGFVHPNFGNPSTFRCLGRNCPLCKQAKKMLEEEIPDAWRFKSTPVFLYYIMDKNKKFYFIRLSNTAQTAVVDAITAMATAKVNPVDLDKGRWATIRITKTENKTKWKCTFEHDSDNVPMQVRQELKMAPELSAIYRDYSLKELEMIAAGEKLPTEYNKQKNEKEESEDGADLLTQPTQVMKSSPVKDEEQSTTDETIEEKRERIKRKINATSEKNEK